MLKEADAQANLARSLLQEDVPIDFATAKARIHATVKEKWRKSIKDDKYVKRFGPKWRKLGDEDGLTRLESVEAARLRTGHSLQLREYRKRIKIEEDARCPHCNNGIEDLVHFMVKCPAHTAVRTAVFGRHNPTLEETLQNARLAVTYLRRLGRL